MIKHKVGAIFNCKQIDENGKIIMETGKFPNTFTRYGLEYLHTWDAGGGVSLTDSINYCVIGDGTGATDPTNDFLESKLYATNNRRWTDRDGNSDPIYANLKQEHIFSGTFTGGEAVSEVGLSPNGDELINRQLLPVTLNMQSGQSLVIESELIVYSGFVTTESDSVTGSFLFNGSPLTYTIKINEGTSSQKWTNPTTDNYWNRSDAAGSDYRGILGKQRPGIWKGNLFVIGADPVRASSYNWTSDWNGNNLRTYCQVTWNAGTLDGEYDAITFHSSTRTTGEYDTTWYMELDTPITMNTREELTLNFEFEFGNI